MASVTARRKCPDLIFVKPRFEVYKAVSRQIRDIFLDYTPLVEPLSLDEAYLDVTENLKGMTSATEIALDIRRRILETTGLTASAGVSYNKFLAKLASDYNKPNGQFVVTPKTGPAFIESLPVRKFHGVGPATAERMRKLRIETGADLRACSLMFLTQHFGSSGEWYYWIARGVDPRRVRPDRERKSVGAETTFFEDLSEIGTARDGLLPLIDKVWRHCDANGLYGRTITVKIKYSDFHQVTRSHTSRKTVASLAALRDRSFALLDSVFPVKKGIRLLGVTVSSFPEGHESEDEPQLSFDL
jgi:DNA polymerase-4